MANPLRRAPFTLALTLLLAVTLLPPASAQKKPSATASRLARAADSTTHFGFPAQLPPHISTLLGLSKETASPVKQSVLRAGTSIRGFDLPDSDPKHIVLFTVDESTSDQTLYLTSLDGSLERVVKVKAGVGSQTRISDSDEAGFQKELRFWLDRLAPATAK